MKSKKLLAVLAAAIMVVLPTTAAYAEQTDLTGASVTSDAKVNYVDAKKVIKITVPTSASLKFSLDPQNLAKAQGVGVWNPTDGGSIIPQAVMTVVNKSAVAVKTKVDFTLSDTSTPQATIVDTATNINDGTDKKIYMTLTPANAKTSVDAAEIASTTAPTFVTKDSTPVEYTAAELAEANVPSSSIHTYAASGSALFGEFICADKDDKLTVYNQVEVPVIKDKVAATTATTVKQFNAESGLASTTNATKVSGGKASLAYIMDKASYYVKNDAGLYSLVYEGATTNTNYDTASFIIGGSINKNADWSAYNDTAKISLQAAYTFETMTDVEKAAVTKLTDSHNSIAVAPTDLDPTYNGATSTVNITKGATSFEFPFDLGTGTKAVTVTGVSVTVGTTKYEALGQTVANGKITFSSTNQYAKALMDNLGTYPFVIKTSDNTTHNISLVTK